VLLRKHSLYERQVRGPQDSPAHQGEFTVDVLEQLRVDDVLHQVGEVHPVPAGMPLAQFLDLVAAAAESHFVVVDPAGDLVGVVSLDDLREVIADREVLALGVVGDAMRRPKVLHPTDSLRRALAKYLEAGTDRLPVVDPLRPRKVLGFVGHADVIAGYNRELLRRRARKD
jgi:chloride channel protein, CIC family